MDNSKQKSLDAIIWNLFEQYGNQFVSLFIGIILARLLTPNDYGLIGMISVFFLLSRVFVNGGFGLAYIQNQNADEKDASTIFYFNVAVSILLYFCLWVAAPFIADFYDEQILISLTRVSALVIIIDAFSMMQINMLAKAVKFKKKSIISIVSTLLSGLLGVYFALSGFKVWSLVVQNLSSSIFISLGLWWFYNWRPSLVFSKESLKKMFSFSSWLLFGDLTNTIFNNIYIFIIGKYFSSAELGFYTKAKGYSGMIVQKTFSAIKIVSFPVFSGIQTNKEELKSKMRKFLTSTLFYIVPIIAVLITIANPLIYFVLTEKWVPMVPFFQILLVTSLFFPIQIMNSQMLSAIGKAKLVFRVTIIRNVLRLLNVILILKYGIMSLLVGELIVTLFTIFEVSSVTKKYIDYGALDQLKDLWKLYASCMLSITIGYFSSLVFDSREMILVAGGSITLLIYFLSQYLINKKILIENIKLIKSKIFQFLPTIRL